MKRRTNGVTEGKTRLTLIQVENEDNGVERVGLEMNKESR